MAASRKTYRLIAERLRCELNYANSDVKDVTARAIRSVADALKIDNPAFRYDIFFEAVGLDIHGYVPGTLHTRKGA